MQVTSKGIVDGIIGDKYGVRGVDFIGDMPNYSLPLKIENAPEDTKVFAVVLIDHDAIPVAGFTWIHWAVTDLNRRELEDNAAVKDDDLIQGTNSWSSSLLAQPLTRMQAATYGGMVPPDKPHTYLLRVFALNEKTNLEKGFYLNELYAAMEGHILAKAELRGIYNNIG